MDQPDIDSTAGLTHCLGFGKAGGEGKWADLAAGAIPIAARDGSVIAGCVSGKSSVFYLRGCRRGAWGQTASAVLDNTVKNDLCRDQSLMNP